MLNLSHRARKTPWRTFSILLGCLTILVTVSPSAPARATSPSQSSFPLYLPLVVSRTPTASTDSGFRPAQNGFSFANYGGDEGYTNLTPAEVLRMFGANVCASAPDGSACALTPAAEQWMDQQNQGMSGGHCEGFAVLSLLLYAQQLNAQDFGAATVAALQIEGNEKLQREIAYWFTTQATQPAQDAWVQGTPNEIVQTLRASYQAGKAAEYVIGFYKGDRSGGHAVSPIAVEDRADGTVAILIYDNNYPGITREIMVNPAQNTWTYNGSTNPNEPADEYEGDAQSRTLELAPIPVRLQQQACPFCENSAGQTSLQQATRYNEIYLDGDADLLISEDQSGRSIGYRNGQFVNEIGGATARSTKYLVPIWQNKDEPVYKLPTTVDFTISIDGSLLTGPSASTVAMIGPGYMLEVNDIMLEAGQVDELNVSANGTQLAYRTETGETPDILLGFETPQADYTLLVKGFDLVADDVVYITIDEANGRARLDAASDEGVAFDLLLERLDNEGAQVFGTGEDLIIGPTDVLYVEYAAWQGNGQPLELQIDRNGDGTIDETVELIDATDLFEE